jgi:serine/threonine protein kinase
MGAVYLAHDTQLDRQIALKVSHFTGADGPEVLERFYREARIACTLAHPNLCPVHDVGQIDGVYYLTMPYIEGKPLREFIRKGRLPTQQTAAGLVRLLAQAMQAAHDRGIIHRDLKPANIMITPDKQPVVMDFGLARRLPGSTDVRVTQSGALLGTPAYMPPEQVNADVKAMGPGCDIYSLGVILYELLTQRLPFEGPLGELMTRIMRDPPPRPSQFRPDLSPALEAICLKALQKKPADRYPSMNDFATALEQYLRGDLQVLSKSLDAIQAYELCPEDSPPPAREEPAPQAEFLPHPAEVPKRQEGRRRRRSRRTFVDALEDFVATIQGAMFRVKLYVLVGIFLLLLMSVCNSFLRYWQGPSLPARPGGAGPEQKQGPGR